jgi:hypothetical protein
MIKLKRMVSWDIIRLMKDVEEFLNTHHTAKVVGFALQQYRYSSDRHEILIQYGELE